MLWGFLYNRVRTAPQILGVPGHRRQISASTRSMHCLLPGAATALPLLLSKVELLPALRNQKLGGKNTFSCALPEYHMWENSDCLLGSCFKTEPFWLIARTWKAPMFVRCFSTPLAHGHPSRTWTPLDRLLKSVELVECCVSLREELNSANAVFQSLKLIVAFRRTLKRYASVEQPLYFASFTSVGRLVMG